MSGMIDELAEAEAKIERLKRMIRAAPCATVGCRWESYGGTNAGCGDGCNCSVPVNICAVCGDCDYGDNAEGNETRARCAKGATDVQ